MSGRPKLHANAAARVRAHRKQYSRLVVPLNADTLDAISSIASYLDHPVAAVARSMLKFALANRAWKQVGLYGTGRLDQFKPAAPGPEPAAPGLLSPLAALSLEALEPDRT